MSKISTRYYHRQDGKVTLSQKIGNHTYTKTMSQAEYQKHQDEITKLTFIIVGLAVEFITLWVINGFGSALLITALTPFSIMALKKKFRQKHKKVK